MVKYATLGGVQHPILQLVNSTMRSFLHSLLSILLLSLSTGSLSAQSYRTRNFLVSGPYAELVAKAAEHSRASLSREWLGYDLPDWSQPAAITTSSLDGPSGGGQTSFSFTPYVVVTGHWSGNAKTLFDNVVPHEVLHAVFASHFRQPLPRWYDEGAASMVESPSMQQVYFKQTIQDLSSKPSRAFPFNSLFALVDYPSRSDQVFSFYGQSHTVAKYLLALKGKHAYIAFGQDGLSRGWEQSLRIHYSFQDNSDFQVKWLSWLRKLVFSKKPSTVQIAVQSSSAISPAQPSSSTLAQTYPFATTNYQFCQPGGDCFVPPSPSGFQPGGIPYDTPPTLTPTMPSDPSPPPAVQSPDPDVLEALQACKDAQAAIKDIQRELANLRNDLVHPTNPPAGDDPTGLSAAPSPTAPAQSPSPASASPPANAPPSTASPSPAVPYPDAPSPDFAPGSPTDSSPGKTGVEGSSRIADLAGRLESLEAEMKAIRSAQFQVNLRRGGKTVKSARVSSVSGSGVLNLDFEELEKSHPSAK